MVLFFLFSFSLYLLNIFKRSSFSKIICFQWILLSILMLFPNKDFIQISFTTKLIFFLYISIFLISFEITPIISQVPKINFGNSFLFYKCAVWIACLFSFYKIFIFIIYNDLNTFLLLKSDDVLGSAEKVFSGYFWISIPAILSLVYVSGKKFKKIPWFEILIAILLAFSTLSKSFILIVFLYINIFLIKKKVFKPSSVLIFSLFIVITLSITLHFFMNRLLPSDSGILQSIYKTFYVYFMSGISGFQVFFNERSLLSSQILFNDLFSLFGRKVTNDDIILPWSSIGLYDSNVYTGFAYAISSLGIFISCFYYMLLGFLGKQLYNSNSFFRSFLWPLYLFCSIFLFHQDFFIAGLKIWISYILISFFATISNSYD